MSHDAIVEQPLQDDRPLAAQLHSRLVQFVRPVLSRLAQRLDIRLVQTASISSKLSSPIAIAPWGCSCPNSAPFCSALSRHPPAPSVSATLSMQPTGQPTISAPCSGKRPVSASRRCTMLARGAGRLGRQCLGKPESHTGADWCAVRSSKARRLARRRPGFSLPPSGPPCAGRRVTSCWTIGPRRARLGRSRAASIR
jgi:hypothetical protein